MNSKMLVNCDGKEYHILKASHLFENRETTKGTAKHHRGLHIDDKRYKQLLTKALYSGLMEFREKGVAVVTFYDTNNRPFGVLIDLNDENRIFVITVFRGPAGMPLNKCFIKVQNRINIMRTYTMEPLKKEDISKSKNDKIMRLCSNTKSENDEFAKAMRSVSEL